MVHAITPLEENKSFLEKVKLGEKLCGISSSESLLSTSSWSSTAAAGTEEVTAKKSAENLQNRMCKGTEEILGSLLYGYSPITVKNFVTMYTGFDPCYRGNVQLRYRIIMTAFPTISIVDYLYFRGQSLLQSTLKSLL